MINNNNPSDFAIAAVVSEFTPGSLANPATSVAKSGESGRAGDGNLLPKARAGAKRAIERHIRKAGRVNISELSRLLGLSRPTVRAIVDECLAGWRADIEDQAVVSYQWCESVVQEIDTDPEKFDKDAIARVRLKMSLLDKLRTLRKALRKGGE